MLSLSLSLAAYTLTACALFSYLVIRPVVYYFIDPKGLRKYPNWSWIAPFTDFKFMALCTKGYRSRDMYLAHIETGEPILRIGPNSLSFHHPQALKDIYGHNTPCTKDLKETVLAGTHRQLFDVVDKPEHSRKRKLLSAAFALKNLEKWEYKVTYTAEKLFKAFDAHCTKPQKESETPNPSDVNLDYNHWINLWTIEAINYIALSAEMDILDTGKDEVTCERKDGTTYKGTYRFSMNQAAWLSSIIIWDYNLFPWTKWLARSLPGSSFKKYFIDGADFEDVVWHQASERLRRYQRGEQLEDFFSCLMENKVGMTNNLEWGEIVAEVGAIINAGAETTAIALTQHLYLLLKHPNVLAKLRAEIDAVADTDEEVISYDKVKDLPYLRAVIDEGLRIMPPTSAGLPRRTPAAGARIMGEWIAGDTSVNMTIYGSHRNPDIFPDQESYKPERWVDPEDRRKMEPHFVPFSAGARGCIGRNITYLEQIMMLASLVHRYEFSLKSPDWELERMEAFNILCGKMPIKIWMREVHLQ